MKTMQYAVGLLILGVPGWVLAQQAPLVEEATNEEENQDLVSEIGFLPGFKRGARVETDERNPFARRRAEIVDASGESEAARIRGILEGLTVRGRSRGPNGLRVLLGAMRLEQGTELPPMIENQSDRLIVSSLTESEIEISWLKESGNQLEDARTLKIPIDVDHDSVRVKLNVGLESEASDNWIELPFESRRERSEPTQPDQLGINGGP